jgi:Lrp/AsnC family transcriptional regulator
MVELDEADRRILREIQKNPELTLRELAEIAGLSHTPCWRRLQRMQELGVLSPKQHILNAGMLGYEIVVFCFVRTIEHRREKLAEFETAVLRIPEIVQCYSATGNFDYILRVIAKSVRAYEETVKEAIVELPNVKSINTSFTLKEIKNDLFVPV